ncbi:MAG: hypothetical protein ACE1ZA_20205, partial [Pseudomonadales bacterium]
VVPVACISTAGGCLISGNCSIALAVSVIPSPTSAVCYLKVFFSRKTVGIVMGSMVALAIRDVVKTFWRWGA